MIKRKVLTLLLVAVLIISNIVPIAAEVPNISVGIKATTLNKLNILKGANNNFGLEGQMTRAMAATFVVRMLGKEQEVLSNTAKYNNTGFSDVPKDAWYASYVGYCAQQKIIGGYSGKFSPNDMITEKAFIKLVLGILGYTQDEDFTWDNIFTVTYIKGIIKDEAYKIRTIDDTNYKRGAAIELLYNALTITKKNSENTVIKELIQNKLVDENAAIELGVWSRDKVVTQVVDITTNNPTILTVTLNEVIQQQKIEDITIYEKQNSSSKLSVKSIKQNGSVLTIQTDYQSENKAYVLQLNKVIDSDKNIVQSITKEFLGYKSQTIQSDFFKISNVAPQGDRVLKVYFTQKINMGAEFPTRYEIMQGNTSFMKGDFNNITVRYLKSEENAILLYLKGSALSAGIEYKLKISGELSSAYGIKLNNGIGDEASFIGIGSTAEAFDFTNATIINENTIEVQFDQELDMFSAENAANYKIKKSNGSTVFVLRAVISGEETLRGKVVRLSIIEKMNKEENYELTVQGVGNCIGNKTIDKSTYMLYGLTLNENPIRIIHASAENSKEIIVYVSRRLNRVNAKDAGKFIISGSGYSATPSHVYYDPNVSPNMLKLYLPTNKALSSGNSYTVTMLGGILDEVDNILTGTSDFTILGSSEALPKISPVEAKVIGDKYIKVTFNGEISNLAPNTIASNYSIEYGSDNNKVTEHCNNVSYIDARTLVLHFENFDISKGYRLKINSLLNYAGDPSVYSNELNNVEVLLGH